MALEIESGTIFNSDQLARHMKIYAGPGAGKTYFLVENVKNIITHHPTITRSKNRKVLCITYTNAAVDEINRRLWNFQGSVEIFTIHGFIIQYIIKPFQDVLRAVIKSDFDIEIKGSKIITSQQEGLSTLSRIPNEDVYEAIKAGDDEEVNYSKKIMSDVAVDIRRYNSDPERFLELSTPDKLSFSQKIKDSHAMAIKQYVWDKARKLTHDEILYFGYRILQASHTALYAMRVQFPFIFIDEFQDTNPIQTKLIELIGEKSTVIGVIGDRAQSIYSFQGAKPSQFQDLAILGDRELKEYVIKGNRRSSSNIVHFCNFLRQQDTEVIQKSIKPYINEEERVSVEAKKITLLIGDSSEIMETISEVVADGGVVLTRTWAAAFAFIRGVTPDQVNLLKEINNWYYNSSTVIRRDIEEFGFVSWVRSFKVIFGIWNGYRNGSLVETLKALDLIEKIDYSKIKPKHVALINTLSRFLFSEVTEETTDRTATEIIWEFNRLISSDEYKELLELLGDNFPIKIFEEWEDDNLKKNVETVNWHAAYLLFTEVFSLGSKYMTVHQAKGLEWQKVVVSVSPSKYDYASIEGIFENPTLIEESSSDEFTRIFYVACSRAEEELYVHLPRSFSKHIIEQSLKNFTNKSGYPIEYQFA